MAELSPRLLVAFVRSVAVLGLPADAQVSWLQRLFADATPVVDELALEFDYGFQLVPSFLEQGWLEAAALPALKRLSSQLDAMSGEQNAELWTVEALAREHWDRVRGLAREALSLLS
jgi:hypothetical protein